MRFGQRVVAPTVRAGGRFALRVATPGRIAAVGAAGGTVLVAQRLQEIKFPFSGGITFGGGGPIPVIGNGGPISPPVDGPTNGGQGNLLPLLILGGIVLAGVAIATRKKR